ncbi:MAG: leucine-rich repeat protein, partial [Paramuribaculum sp.]|nr:leucine-rich repeat protein [Paramuribaculum sp.]
MTGIEWSFILDKTNHTATLTHPVPDPESKDSYLQNGRYHFEAYPRPDTVHPEYAYMPNYAGDANGGPVTEFTKTFIALWSPMIDRDYYRYDLVNRRNDSWTMAAIRIPATFEHDGATYTVTAIGERAFSGSDIVTVHLPSTITSIGDYAFADCQNFVGLPADGSAFEVIPASVTTLGKGVFSNCATLERMTIGDGVKTIPAETFDKCPALQRLTIGRSVESIKCPLPAALRKIAFRGEKKPEMLTETFETQTSVWVDSRYASAYPASWRANSFSIIPEREELIFYKGFLHPVNFTVEAPVEYTNNSTNHFFGYPGIDYGGGIDQNYREVTLVFGHNQLGKGEQLVSPPYRIDFSDEKAYLSANYITYNTTTHRGSFPIAMRSEGDHTVTVTMVDPTLASYTWPVKVIEGIPVDTITIEGPMTLTIGGDDVTYKATCKHRDNKLTPSNTNVIWSCDNPELLTIDENGTAHAIEAGYATIHARSADPACYTVEAILTVYVDNGAAAKYPVQQTVLKDPYTVPMYGNTININQIPYRTVTTDFYYFFNEDGTAEITYPGARRDDTYADGGEVPATPYKFDYPGHEPLKSRSSEDYYYYTATITNYLMRHPKDPNAKQYEALHSSLSIETLPYVTVVRPDGIPQATLYKATKIGARAFAGSNIRYINFYDYFDAAHNRPQIEEIGDYAFLDCKEFIGYFPGSHDVVVPNTVKKLGKGVFKGCEKLTRIVIGDGVEEIPEETFDGCENLDLITLGSSVKTVNCDIICNTIVIRSKELPEFKGKLRCKVNPTEAKPMFITGYNLKGNDDIEHFRDVTDAGPWGKEGITMGGTLKFDVSPEALYTYVNYTDTITLDFNSIFRMEDELYSETYNKGFGRHYPYPWENSISFSTYTNKRRVPEWTPVAVSDWPADARAVTPIINKYGDFARLTLIKFAEASKGNGTQPYHVLLRANDGTNREVNYPIYVKDGIKTQSISLTSSGGNILSVGQSSLIRVTLEPTNATGGNYIFTSDNKDVAIVENDGSVTTKGVGTVTITCRLDDKYSNYPEAKIELTVVKEGVSRPARVWKYHFPFNEAGTNMLPNGVTRTAADYHFLTIKPAEGEVTEQPEAMITFPNATEEKIKAIEDKSSLITYPYDSYNFAYPGYRLGIFVDNRPGQLTVTRKISEWIETLKNSNGKNYTSTYRFQLDIPSKLTFGDTEYAVKKISAGAFANSNIARIDIPEGVTEIGDYAFAFAENFYGIESNAHNTIIPSTVTKIGRGLFKGCKNMYSMIIGDGVEIVPEETFAGCSSLHHLGFGANVREINCGFELHAVSSDNACELAFRSVDPPQIKDDVTINYPVKKIIVMVPAGSEQKYKEAFQQHSNPTVKALADYIKPFSLQFNKTKEIKAYAGQLIPLYYNLVSPSVHSGATTFYFIYPAEPGSPGVAPFQGTIGSSGSYESPSGNAGAHGAYLTIDYDDPDEVLAGNIIANHSSTPAIKVKYKHPGEHEVRLTTLDVSRASDVVKVTTIEGVAVVRIDISAPTAIRPGTTAKATAWLQGFNGQTPTNQGVRWQAINPPDKEVISIDPETGVITALQVGTATISCHSTDPLCSDIGNRRTIEVSELIQQVKLMAVDEEGNELFEIKPEGAAGTLSNDECGIYEWTGNKIRTKLKLYPEGIELALDDHKWRNTCEAENPTFTTNFCAIGDGSQPEYDMNNMVIDCRRGYAEGEREGYPYEILNLAISSSRMLNARPFEARYPIRVKTEMKDIDIEVPEPPAPDLPGADEEHVLVVDDEHTDRIDLNVRIDKDATDRYVMWEVEDKDIATVAALDDEGNEI